MIETQAIRNICVETAKALSEAASSMQQYGCSIKGRVALDITLRGVSVDGVYLSAGNVKDSDENEICIKGIELAFTSSSRHHVPDN